MRARVYEVIPFYLPKSWIQQLLYGAGEGAASLCLKRIHEQHCPFLYSNYFQSLCLDTLRCRRSLGEGHSIVGSLRDVSPGQQQVCLDNFSVFLGCHKLKEVYNWCSIKLMEKRKLASRVHCNIYGIWMWKLSHIILNTMVQTDVLSVLLF